MKKPLNIGLVGPLAPPSGGMANQTQQLARLLKQDGVGVEIVRTNSPYKPKWISKVIFVRAFFRLSFYLIALWKASGRVDLFHIMANSGWAWHLFCVPAVWVAKIRGVPSVINYRGGEAEKFFEQSFRWVKPTLLSSKKIIVPSSFLNGVFSAYGIETTIVSNIIDPSRFYPLTGKAEAKGYPRILISRNLEPIYDIETGLHVLKSVLTAYPDARLIVAGSGPDRERLERISIKIGISKSVDFTGRIDSKNMPELYRSVHMMLNTSLVDNMPNSLLEALASDLPVVSTNVGGVPHLVEDRISALLTPPKDIEAMSSAIIHLCRDKELAARLVDKGRTVAKKYTWSEVRDTLFGVYRNVLQGEK